MKNDDKTIDIVVVGYPKSGNTWVTRLVAELVGCPVAGFLDSDHDEIATEGLDRESNYRCFKSHHQLDELLKLNIDTRNVIYVVRDPRDICISGAGYFQRKRRPSSGALLRKFPRVYRISRKIGKSLLTPPGYQLERMIKAVLHGSKDMHCWLRVPWAEHYKPYRENHYFFVKYEDLLSDPDNECRKILAFLSIERDEQQIKDAIKQQSFKNRKQAFITQGQLSKAAFMRVGRKGQWKQGLSKKQKKMFSYLLADELNQFGYPVSDDAA